MRHFHFGVSGGRPSATTSLQTEGRIYIDAKSKTGKKSAEFCFGVDKKKKKEMGNFEQTVIASKEEPKLSAK